ncbi:MAG: response regulator [Chloroflexi bacterium]|nr:response regulator [Ardenticatenaceae bacterium]MBL1130517.1 response regulator [Chloroflexota bacterium]NOG36607.1 response regulator [Chloroflexota bacterium]
MKSRVVTILIVEDDLDMLNGITDALEMFPSRYHLRAVKAENGQIALEMMRQQPVDLIVSDIMMPGMDGFEFLRYVRQNPDWTHIPFVFLTARGKETDVRKGRLSDADLYLTKPFVMRELTELIQTQLDRSFERRKRREQTLESLKKNMMQILNHEFRTPLTYVTAYYDMLDRYLSSLETRQADRNYGEYLHGIQTGCVRLTNLVSALIQVIELRSGMMAQQFAQRRHRIDDLNGLVQAVIDGQRPFADEEQVALLFEPAARAPSFWGDAAGLQTAFDALLNNAIKFTEPVRDRERLVQVTVFTQGREVGVAFSDTGLGIPAAMHERIFDLFEQYNRSLMEQQGAGIGLTIARDLVELHHGRILLQSEENKGSVFTVLLPIYASEGEPPARPANNRIPATLLLVEDEENLLYGLADLLMLFEGRYDLHILTATNGREGLDILQNYQPDLIISDIMMPQMDGYQFLQTVRENPHWVHIPFIFLTAKGEKQDEYKGRRLGVEEYIIKPYEPDDVLKLVEKRLDKHFQSQQLAQADFEELKRGILNLVTREMMQPLTAVNVHTLKLAQGLDGVESPEELAASLVEIKRGSERLNDLVKDLITLAELQTGEATVSYTWEAQPIAAFGMLLYELSQVYGRQYHPDTVVTCAFLPEAPTIFGNSRMLSDCIERLLKFSITQAETRPPAAHISLSQQDEEVQVSVTAVAPLQASALACFQQVLMSDEINLIEAPDYAASLYIVKQYVALHHGRLSGHSSPESGSCFTITLPIHVPT